ncbi:MAG TPA: S9 family peptidase [Caulobacteraceae bacterium]|jgi:dipeptidyl aminopeptidase/acylaminoacyl peptidase
MRIAIVAAASLGLAAQAWAAPPPLDDYGKLPAVDGMKISPAGDLLAFIAPDGDRQQVRISKVGGAPLVNLSVGDLKVRDVEWLGEGHLLVQASRADKADPSSFIRPVVEITESTIVDVATGKSAAVFHDDPHILPATFGYYGYGEIGGKTYGFFAGQPLSDSGSSASSFHNQIGYMTIGHANLYRVDLDTGRGEKVAGGSDLYRTDWVVGRDGGVAAHAEYQTKTGEWRLYADPDDRQTIMRADDPTGNVDLLSLGRSQGTVLVRMPASAAGGDWRFVEFPETAGAAGEDLFGDFGVRDVIVAPRTGLLLGAASTDQRTIQMFDPKLQGRYDAVRKAFPGETVGFVSASDNFGQLVVRTTGPGDSGTYFFVDLTAGKANAVGWNYPTILQGDVAEVREVNYKAADGLEIEGLLTLPPGRPAKNLPLVVMPHGGPEDRDYAGFDWWAQAFASRGYAVFQPNFRGSDGFGKAFRDAGFGQWGRKMQTDISDGVDALAKQGLVDPKRACIAGISYGGYAALAGVTVQQGLYRCAVSIGGIGNLNDLMKWDQLRTGEQSETMRIEKQMMGVGSIGDPSVAAYSPQRLAAKADAPILLMYGADDTVVDPKQSLDMAGALKSAGKPVQLVALPGEDHWLSRQTGRIAVVKASVDFVVKNNPPD